MRTHHISIDNTDQAELLKGPDGPPERRFTGQGVLGDMGLFGIYRAVVSPQPEELEGHVSLSPGQPDDELESVPDAVKLLKEKARC